MKWLEKQTEPCFRVDLAKSSYFDLMLRKMITKIAENKIDFSGGLFMNINTTGYKITSILTKRYNFPTSSPLPLKLSGKWLNCATNYTSPKTHNQSGPFFLIFKLRNMFFSNICSVLQQIQARCWPDHADYRPETGGRFLRTSPCFVCYPQGNFIIESHLHFSFHQLITKINAALAKGLFIVLSCWQAHKKDLVGKNRKAKERIEVVGAEP